MSVMAVGPALDLDGPLPVAPPHSLLETSGVVVDDMLDLSNVPAAEMNEEQRRRTRVLNGVVVYGYPTGCPWLWEPCSAGTFRVKSEESEQLLPRFDSIVVGQSITCSAIGIGDPETFSARISAVLDATLSSGVERALAEGVVGSSNPFFGDADVEILNSGTAVNPRVGISFLEQAIGTTCRSGMIHATPAVIAALLAPVGARSGELTTGNDTPIVSGMGYQGVDTAFIGTPGATQDWVFATGPVNVYLGPLVMTDIAETLERTLNDVTFRAERYVLAVWDTALQSAVLVDWST